MSHSSQSPISIKALAKVVLGKYYCTDDINYSKIPWLKTTNTYLTVLKGQESSVI